MKKTALFVLLLPALLYGQVVLSEIMFNPEGNERTDEFIELYNCGDQAVDLSGWSISDGSKANRILAHQSGTILQPKKFALLLAPKYFTDSRAYDALIPGDALLLTIDASQFGAYGLNNTKGERVSLQSPNGEESAYEYTPDNPDGYSEEKIDLIGSNTPENWQNSRKKGGTPGAPNSVSKLTFDLEVQKVTISPQFPTPEDSLSLDIMLTNRGRMPIDSCSLQIRNRQAYLSILWSKSLPLRLSTGDSMHVHVHLAPLYEGDHTLTIEATAAGDENFANNRVEVIIHVESSAAPQVVINEIMYLTDERSEEWIELYNAGCSAVNLNGWTIADRKKAVVITQNDFLLAPESYAVLGGTPSEFDTTAVLILMSLPELNNSGDDLYLRDSRNRPIDAVSYVSAMGGAKGVSLERVDSRRPSTETKNWGSCLDSLGHTAGRRNSLSPRDYDLAALEPVRVTPNRPIEGDLLTFCLAVVNCGLLPIDSAYAVLVSKEGICLQQSLPAYLAAGDTLTIEFLWRAESSGLLTFRFACGGPKDENPKNDTCSVTFYVSPAVNQIIINEIMYNPEAGKGEWIELYHRGETPLDLRGWSLADGDTTKKIQLTKETLVLSAGIYCIIAKDSSVAPPAGVPFVVLRRFPSLSNTADTLHLFDPSGRLHEQVIYSAAWGGARGRSLERVHPDVSAAERSNWTTCVDPDGHTMGRRNSVAVQELSPNARLAAAPNPFSPDGDGIDELTAISYSLPIAIAQVNLKIFDIRGRLVRRLLNYELSGTERTVFWDGRDEEGRVCRMGIYVILLEARSNGSMLTARCSVVLAARL
ncbi:MAG: lamin tail domain-containing protein [candidate division KSB1 bacterium]|nr:lamin tail domain-containing protein [candidate division KSB1 bacterium]